LAPLDGLPTVRVQSSTGPFDVTPVELLHLLEVLALNEDVKYWYKSGDKDDERSITSAGRPSTMKTCARALGAGLGDEHPMTFAYALTKGRGVASLARADAVSRFSELSP
jgi:hypothetical protein